jgi:polysaccharide pyruvyl transferase WcaK-like protein
MPVAAAAKARKAAYHSHTVVVEQRDDCSTARQQVPGCALAISTGDPAFRLSSSRPEEDNGVADSVKSRKQEAETFYKSLEVDGAEGPAGIWYAGQREFRWEVGRGRIAAFEERIFLA